MSQTSSLLDECLLVGSIFLDDLYDVPPVVIVLMQLLIIADERQRLILARCRLRDQSVQRREPLCLFLTVSDSWWQVLFYVIRRFVTNFKRREELWAL